MQYAVLVISVLALVAPSLTAPQGSPAPAPDAASIRRDIDALLELIPVHKMEEVVVDYLAGDAEVKAFVEFMRTDAFKSIVRKLDAIPEFRKMLSYLESAGLPAYKHVNAIHTVLGVESDFPPTPTVSGAPGILGLVNAVREMLPMDKIANLYLQSNDQLMGLVDKFRGDDLVTIIQTLEDLPEVKAAQAQGFLPKIPV